MAVSALATYAINPPANAAVNANATSRLGLNMLLSVPLQPGT